MWWPPSSFFLLKKLKNYSLIWGNGPWIFEEKNPKILVMKTNNGSKVGEGRGFVPQYPQVGLCAIKGLQKSWTFQKACQMDLDTWETLKLTKYYVILFYFLTQMKETSLQRNPSIMLCPSISCSWTGPLIWNPDNWVPLVGLFLLFFKKLKLKIKN